VEEPKPDKKAPKAVPLPVSESTCQAVAQPSSFGTDRPWRWFLSVCYGKAIAVESEDHTLIVVSRSLAEALATADGDIIIPIEKTSVIKARSR
jgi:hypothetical protein